MGPWNYRKIAAYRAGTFSAKFYLCRHLTTLLKTLVKNPGICLIVSRNYLRDSKTHWFLGCTTSKRSFQKCYFPGPTLEISKYPVLLGASAPHKFPTIRYEPIVKRSASHNTIFRKNYKNFFRNTKVISTKGDKAKSAGKLPLN